MLKQQLFEDENPMLRLQLIKDNCIEEERITYPHNFEEEEMEERKTSLAEIDLQVEEMEDEKKAYIQQFKDKLKPLKENKRSLLKDLRRGYEEITDVCYKFIDRETNMVGYYNGAGELVKEVPCGAKDRQKSMFEDLGKTGTDD